MHAITTTLRTRGTRSDILRSGVLPELLRGAKALRARVLRTGVLVPAVLAPIVLGTSACSGLPNEVLPLTAHRTSTAAPAHAAASSPKPAAPAPRPTVSVGASGWGQTAGSTWVTATLHGDGDAAGSAAVTFTAYGSGGQVLAFGTSAAVQVVPGQTTAVGTLLDVPPGEQVAKLRTDVATTLLPRPRTTRYVLGGVNVQARGQGASRLLATLSTAVAAPTLVTAVCVNKAGQILGGGATALGTLPPGGLKAFAVDPLVVPAAPASCSVYTAVTTG